MLFGRERGDSVISCENLKWLRGYMGELPFFSKKLVIANIDYLDGQQSIYHAPIKSGFRILYFVLSGAQDVKICAGAGETLQLREGTVFQVCDGVEHQFLFKAAPRCRMLIVYYRIQPLVKANGDFEPFNRDEEELILSFACRKYVKFPINDRMSRELELLDEYMSTRTCGDALKVQNQLSNIFLSVFQKNSFASGKSIEEDENIHLNRNVRYLMIQSILESAVSGQSLMEISESLHYTPRHIQRMVSDYYGESFSKVVANMRLSYTMALLADTDLTIKEICDRGGYSSVSDMRQRFRAFTGRSPTEFRRDISADKPPLWD